jgi:hypothetical protein
MSRRIINWVGVAAGVFTLLVFAISLYIPWWQITVGDNLLQVNASPVNTNFGLFGEQFTVPLIWALNLASILTLLASGATMLLYSFMPTKPYAKELLGFSYKKPLYVLVAFFVGLIVTISAVGFFGLSVPLMGLANVSLPTSLTMGAQVSASVLANFLFPFYLAIVAVILSIATRFYHRNIVKNLYQKTQPINSSQ